jgi:hypothetical protein
VTPDRRNEAAPLDSQGSTRSVRPGDADALPARVGGHSDIVSPSSHVFHTEATTAAAPTLPAWAWVVVGVASAHVVWFLARYLSGLPEDYGVLPVPGWVYGGLAGVFWLSGVGLLAGNRNDLRAAWLGAIFVLIAAPFAMKLYVGDSTGPAWLSWFRPEVFLGVFFWNFLCLFPTALTGRAHGLTRAVGVVLFVTAVWCAVPGLQTVWASSLDLPGWSRWLFARRPNAVNWLLVALTIAPGFPLLLWRARVSSGERRRRISRFALGLLIGGTPFTVEVFLEEAFSTYRALVRQPVIHSWVGGIIFGALGFIPFLTAYSVLFDRVVDTRLVVRAAIQYVLARYTILLATLVPFVALAVFVIERRHEPLVQLLAGTRPILLVAATSAGVMSLRLRSRWLLALDRRYFRESYDSENVLSDFLNNSRVSSVAELAERLRGEVDRVFHARSELFVFEDGRFRAVHDECPSLPAASTLAHLITADSSPLRLDLAVFSRLPDEERRWIVDGEFVLLIGLRRRDGQLHALLAVSEKLSGLAYSEPEKRLLGAIAGAASLVIDGFHPHDNTEPTADQPALECVRCTRVHPPGVLRCSCGGELREGALPSHFRGVFLVKERIGKGGMGVVYRAMDVHLRRDVAIKALPRVTPRDVARLRREARAMAAVTHPNLAIIHGIEIWRGRPFLIEEYLAGGTLATKLAHGALPVADVINIGITIADLLQYLHGVGIVHCDIKPTNVGFTKQGLLKVLDFGLARVLTQLPSLESEGHDSATHSQSSGAWFGTPRYMSPEAARGERPSPMFDLWSLGVLLFESAAGRVPFEGDNARATLERVVSTPAPDIRDVASGIPDSFARVLNRALSLAPELRPADATAFGRELQRIRGERS